VKLTEIIDHQGKGQAAGMGSYQHIHGADHLALQEGANLAIAAGCQVIKASKGTSPICSQFVHLIYF
jgi:hypothetical protein